MATILAVSPAGAYVGTETFTVNISYDTGSSRLKNTTVTVSLSGGSTIATYNLGLITGNSFTWAPPVSLLNSMPNADIAQVKFAGTPTNILGINMSGEVYAWGYVIVPDTYAPNAPTNLKLTRINNGVPAEWGVCVQNVSQASVSWTAPSGKGGATIAKYEVMLDTSANFSYVATGTSYTLPSLSLSGERTLAVIAIDSRGLKSEAATVSYTVEPYTRPEVTAHTAERCRADGGLDNLGTYIKSNVTYAWSSISGRNSASATVAYKLATDRTYSAETSVAQATDKIFGGSFLATKAYHVRFSITDAVGTVTTYVATVEALTLALSFLAGGEGAAFGKEVSKSGVLETAWPIAYSNGYTIGPGFVGLNAALIIRNNNGTGIAAFLDSGNLAIKGSLQQNQSF